jgi:hypothetical protein
MFAAIGRSPRRRNRAVTLIEAVLYISIALALIVGGLVFFQQASTAAKTSTMVRQLSAVLLESRVLIKGLPQIYMDDNDIDLTQFLSAAGAVPPDMVLVAGSTYPAFSNPFGGETRIVYDRLVHVGPDGYDIEVAQMFTVVTTNVPQGVCARLLTSTSASEADFVPDFSGFLLGGEFTSGFGGTTVVGSGYMLGGVAPLSGWPPHVRGFAMNPTQAGWMCKYGSSNYTDKYTEPDSTPISGNVTVRMIFKVYA